MLSMRHQIGIVSLLLLVATVVIWFNSGSGEELPAVLGALLKVGLTFGAVWLAYPQLSKLPTWLAAITVGSILTILIFRKAAIFLIPLLIIIWFLRPKPQKAAAGRRRAISRESSSSDR